MRRRVLGLVCGVAAAAWLGGCSDDGVQDMDTGTADTGLDAGSLTDFGTEPDVGATDFGVGDSGPQFFDPSIISQDSEEIGGANLFVTVRGTLTSTMPPVVILPTGPMHGQEYLFEPTEFLLGPGGRNAPNRLLVYLDHRATGRSSRGSLEDSEVSVEAHIRDLGNLLEFIAEKTGRDEPVDILGHGYGAGIGALYASRFPNRVRRLVLSNPYPVDIQDHSLWNEEFNSRLDGSALERLLDVTRFNICFRNVRECSRNSWNIIGPTWFCEDTRTVFPTMTFQYLDFMPFGYYISQELREDEYDWSEALGQIPSSIPATVISGPCDPIPLSTPMTYTASIASAVHYEVEGSGHFTLTEQPDEFRRIVVRALSD